MRVFCSIEVWTQVCVYLLIECTLNIVTINQGPMCNYIILTYLYLLTMVGKVELQYDNVLVYIASYMKSQFI